MFLATEVTSARNEYIKIYIKNYINFIASFICSFLNRSNKKRHLSSSSKEDEKPRQQREESPDVSCLDSPMSQGHVFAESLKLNE